jgi:WXXGXW repeat (2 copies)
MARSYSGNVQPRAVMVWLVWKEATQMRNFLRGILAAALLGALPLAANAGVFISVNIAPPVLPVYVQPPMPAPGYIWTPGYWAWGDDGYYWVPGTWVLAPAVGLLWTPGYWGWAGGAYIWYAGYWGPHVGFYGGVNYGFGYSGVGFHGGYWEGGRFVANAGAAREFPGNRVCFNGGAGGIVARPTAGEMIAAHERHVDVTRTQLQHQQLASRDESLRASVSGGHPAIAAPRRPGVSSGHATTAATYRNTTASTYRSAASPSYHDAPPQQYHSAPPAIGAHPQHSSAVHEGGSGHESGGARQGGEGQGRGGGGQHGPQQRR